MKVYNREERLKLCTTYVAAKSFYNTIYDYKLCLGYKYPLIILCKAMMLLQSL